MEAVKTCLAEEFKSLKKKSFRNFPRALLRAFIKELPDYAAVVYITLYDLAELNIRHPGTVIISHRALSLEIGKSESSVRRAIDTLKEFGYISFKQKREPEKNYLPNIIQVSCPEELFQKIQAEEPDRKSKTFFSVSALKAITPLSELPQKPTESIPIVALFERYKAILKDLREAGSSLMQASQQAYQAFSEEEAINLQQYILEMARYPNQDFASLTFPKMAEGCSKMNTIRSINNRDHNLQLTIEEPLPVDKSQKPAWANSFVGSERHFGKANSEIVYFLNAEQRSTIVKKIKWMRKQTDEIHPSILGKYPDVKVLIKEVSFHIMYRNKEKTHDFTHALRSAAKMIRNGTWSIPKRLVQMQIDQREESARKLKQAEIRQASDLKLSVILKSLVESTRPPYRDVKSQQR